MDPIVLMMRRPRFSSAATILGFTLLAGCDLAPTALDELDASNVEHLIRAAADRDPDPAHRVLYQLAAADGDKPDAVSRLPQLDSLFDLALSAEAVTDRDRAERDRLLHSSMVDEAWSAITRGEANTGDRALVSIRRFQAETVVRVLGAPTALLYQTLLERSIREATRQLETKPQNEETPRLEQMIDTIRELRMDARKAFADGDAAGSIDIATHAAGLANTLTRRLPGR